MATAVYADEPVTLLGTADAVTTAPLAVSAFAIRVASRHKLR
jgi:hypothetical protein